MRKIKVFVADVDDGHVESVRQSLRRCQEIELIGSATDGNEAFRQIMHCAPDMLITDIQLPGLDGILLLKALQATERPPVSIVCTQFYSGGCVSKARNYGARYYMYKPIDYGSLPDILWACWQGGCRQNKYPPSQSNVEANRLLRVNAIRELIRDMGIPARLSGCQYLVESVLQLDENIALLRNLSKGLYAAIAERMDTTPAGVERSMRGAIASAYARGCLEGRFKTRPSNKEFIDYLYRRVNETVSMSTEDRHQ